MNLDEINPIAPKFEPGRIVWVLLHSDKSHVYPNPDGLAAWSYDKSQMEVTNKILKLELHNHNYHVVELSIAFPLICNKQAEIEELWKPTFTLIRKAPTVHDRVMIYRRFYQRHRQPHPLIFDAPLKKLLGIEK